MRCCHWEFHNMPEIFLVDCGKLPKNCQSRGLILPDSAPGSIAIPGKVWIRTATTSALTDCVVMSLVELGWCAAASTTRTPTRDRGSDTESLSDTSSPGRRWSAPQLSDTWGNQTSLHVQPWGHPWVDGSIVTHTWYRVVSPVVGSQHFCFGGVIRCVVLCSTEALPQQKKSQLNSKTID